MWAYVLILGWPLLEIALFVVIGGAIGLWATLAWVVLSGMLGVAVLRRAMVRQAIALRDMRDPLRMATGGAMAVLGGILLILPGFFTDALGLLLLLPPVQMLAARWLATRVTVIRPRRREDEVIDGEFTEVPPRRDGPSRWTQID